MIQVKAHELTQQGKGRGEQRRLMQRINGLLQDKHMDSQDNREIKFVIMFMYRVCEVFLLQGHKILPEKECRIGFIHICFLGVNLPKRRNLRQPYFPGVAAFSQIKETPRQLLSASADSQSSSAKNNSYSKVACIWVAHSDLLQVETARQESLRQGIPRILDLVHH